VVARVGSQSYVTNHFDNSRNCSVIYKQKILETLLPTLLGTTDFFLSPLSKWVKNSLVLSLLRAMTLEGGCGPNAH